MKKKIIAMALTTLLAAGLTACGNTTVTTNEESKESKGSGSETETETAEDAEDTSAQKKTLIVYYSATGNTENVANMIAEKTSGNLFELEPVKPYSDEDLDWTNDDSRVSAEHKDEDKREVELVSANVSDWEAYDTVYIGYPIWWGIAAWPVDGFIKANDFTGKTVIPFSTAASSGIGDSGELLQKMAGTGNWMEGECFRGSVSQDDVSEWVAKFVQ